MGPRDLVDYYLMEIQMDMKRRGPPRTLSSKDPETQLKQILLDLSSNRLFETVKTTASGH